MTRVQRPQPMGAKAVRGSDAARRQAALLLEAWSGVRSTQSASDAMGVALTRFYQLEARALQLLVSAMEPRPRGRQVTAETRVAKLDAELKRMKRDVERYQSLYRTAQRALGLTVAKTVESPNNDPQGGKRRRGPRKKARGQAVAQVLLGSASEPVGAEADHGTTQQGSGARAQTVSRSIGQAARGADPPDDVRNASGRKGV